MECALYASSDELEWTGAAGIVEPCEADPSSNSKASLEIDAPFKPEAGPDDVSVSVRFSFDWEAVATPEATFIGVPQVVLGAHFGVRVRCGTYSNHHHRPMQSPADMKVQQT